MSGSQPYGLAYFEKHLYYTDPPYERIMRALIMEDDLDRDISSPFDPWKTDIQDVVKIKIYHDRKGWVFWSGAWQSHEF